jgi:glycosyltransferase involved in cell wall biosynthesis
MAIRVLYLTWGEDLATSGILENQVINQLIATRKTCPEIVYHYLCGMPVFWRKRHKRRDSPLAEKVLRLQAAGISVELFYYWLPVRARQMAYVCYPLFRPIFFGWFHRIRQAVRKHASQIIHARAYTGGVVCTAAIGALEIKTPWIFDTRGLYVDELLHMNYIKEKSLLHKLWLFAEERAYNSASMIVNVNKAFSKYLEEKFSLNGKKVKTIHTSVNTEIFKQPERASAERLRRIKAKAPILVYCGSLGGRSYHRVDALFSVFDTVCEIFREAELHIISPANPESIATELTNKFSNAAELLSRTRFSRTHTAHDTVAILAQADIAIFSFHDHQSNGSQHLSDVELGSKTGEYLATGLPVLVNNHAKAAAEIINSTKTGISYELRYKRQFQHRLADLVRNYSEYSRRARKVAEQLFSARENAKKYREIYEVLIS